MLLRDEVIQSCRKSSEDGEMVEGSEHELMKSTAGGKSVIKV
jgi:hypothetical protein